MNSILKGDFNMKKLIFIFIPLLLVSCRFGGSKLSAVEQTMDRIINQPGTQIIVSGESLNSEYILKINEDKSVSILENRGNHVITDPKEKYDEIVSKLKKELSLNEKITKCRKADSMWIGLVGIKLTVEGAISGNKGNISACYHKGNKKKIEPNYQVRTDTPIVEIRIDDQYYEIVSDYAVNKYNNRMLQ